MYFLSLGYIKSTFDLVWVKEIRSTMTLLEEEEVLKFECSSYTATLSRSCLFLLEQLYEVVPQACPVRMWQ